MFRRPVKEQYMMPVMTPSDVDLCEFVVWVLASVVSSAVHVVHVDRSTVVVKVSSDVSVMTVVTVTMIVLTSVMLSTSSKDVFGLDSAANR